jgi:uncharacterized membrane protein YphA (DoxX/SURF4 family)
MLNPFPDLLNYSFVAPTMLRIVLGFVILNLGIAKLKYERAVWLRSFQIMLFKKFAPFAVSFLGKIQIILGIMFIIGLYTQLAALITTIISFGELSIEYFQEDIIKRSLVFYLLIFTIALSILFTGAGLFALDIPL